jgi:DHA1 family tetracycline resistance protein-like MFS transporter
MNRRQTNYKIMMLMMLIIIEVMGIGIIFPILPQLFIAKSSPLLPVVTSDSIRHFYYGLSIALLPVGMFFGTPYLGALSDKYGRKNIFITCLTMTAISYSLLAIAVYLHSLIMFLLSRLFAGFFAGSYEIAQASAADLSTHENKARNMGWIMFAMSIGFIFGPLITSFTADQTSALSFFGITTPFWIAAFLSTTNAILITLFFTNTFKPNKDLRIHIKKIFSSFLFVFIDSRLTYLTIIFFLLTAAWMGFFTALPLYLAAVFNLKVKSIGLYYCLIGLSNAFSILFVQKHALNFFSLKTLMTSATIICSLLFFALALPIALNYFAVILFICTLIELLSYSGFLAFISNSVTPEEQGITMGGCGATSSLAFILTSFITALVADYNILLPFIMSGALFMLGGLMMLKAK